jgi:Protein of unknown function (DUF3024)
VSGPIRSATGSTTSTTPALGAETSVGSRPGSVTGPRRSRRARQIRHPLRLRAALDPNLTEWSRLPVALLRYNPDSDLWTLYGADRNSHWHRHDDCDPGTVTRPLDEIGADPTCIFWG